MTGRDTRGAAQQGIGFLASGLIATGTDAAVLTLLTRGAGLDPFSARAVAIAVAMVVAYFAHRRFSFAVTTKPSLHQFGKFVSVAAIAALVNYAVYSAVLLLRPGTEPVLALVAATMVAMGVTYLGLRIGVFRRPVLDDPGDRD